MDRFNIPIPPDEDFPEVVVAQRMGEGFKKEYAEYAPRWRFDKRRRAVVVDEKFFYAMADTSERLQAENAKLRALMARMAEALGIDCEWADPNWCKSPCVLEFGCWPNDEHAEIQCPAWAAMRELGVEL
jgi:hypothetical protein